MHNYLVRLTSEGESEEQLVLADNSLHAMRQALVLWWHLEPEQGVLSARRVPMSVQHAFQRADPDLGSPPEPDLGGPPVELGGPPSNVIGIGSKL